jgi:ferritin-like metal-binding protein YciE
MGLFSKPITNLNDLFEHFLQDIYYAENQIVKTLPQMIEKSTNPQLRQAFESHLNETRTHVSRLEKIFAMLGQEAKGVTCEAIDGIMAEAKGVLGDTSDAEVRDAALIACAQAVEHYEMTRYGSLIAFARQLGRDDCARVLNETLGEEKAADEKLTSIAESRVNRLAA